MSHWPGPTLEDYLSDAYCVLDEEGNHGTMIRRYYDGQLVLNKDQFSQFVAIFEHLREEVERYLNLYDEEEGSWRDYRNAVFSEHIIPEDVNKKAEEFIKKIAATTPKTKGLSNPGGEITMDISSVNLNGKLDLGVADISWSIKGPEFVEAEVGVRLLGERVERLLFNKNIIHNSCEHSVGESTVRVSINFKVPAPDDPGYLLLGEFVCDHAGRPQKMDNYVAEAWDMKGNILDSKLPTIRVTRPILKFEESDFRQFIDLIEPMDVKVIQFPDKKVLEEAEKQGHLILSFHEEHCEIEDYMNKDQWLKTFLGTYCKVDKPSPNLCVFILKRGLLTEENINIIASSIRNAPVHLAPDIVERDATLRFMSRILTSVGGVNFVHHIPEGVVEQFKDGGNS